MEAPIKNIDQSISKWVTIPKIFKELISFTNFRRLLVFTLTITWTFYWGSMNYSIFSYDNFKNLLQNFIVLKFIGISLCVTGLFYGLPTFLLRLLFHGYIKDKFLYIKQELKKEGHFSFLRGMHFIDKLFYGFFRDYIFRLGFITKKDLADDVKITDADKEEFLNEVLDDCYKSVCVNLHFILTLIIVWNYVNYWLLALLILILLFMLVAPIGIIIMAMNLDLLERFRRKMLRHKSL